MSACLRNRSHSVLCTTNIIAARLKTYLEGLPHVGIVIDDQNVRLTHFGTYLVIRKLWESIKRLSLCLRHTQGGFHSRKVVSSPVPALCESVIFCLGCGLTREPALGVVPCSGLSLEVADVNALDASRSPVRGRGEKPPSQSVHVWRQSLWRDSTFRASSIYDDHLTSCMTDTIIDAPESQTGGSYETYRKESSHHRRQQRHRFCHRPSFRC